MQRTLSEVIFEKRKQALQQKPLTNKRILPLVTQYHPSVTENWHNYNRTTTIAQRNLQRTPSNFILKRQVPQRYTRESKTKTAVTRMSESRRPLTIYKTLLLDTIVCTEDMYMPPRKSISMRKPQVTWHLLLIN